MTVRVRARREVHIVVRGREEGMVRERALLACVRTWLRCVCKIAKLRLPHDKGRLPLQRAAELEPKHRKL